MRVTNSEDSEDSEALSDSDSTLPIIRSWSRFMVDTGYILKTQRLGE